MEFTQHVVIHVADAEALLRLMREWEEDDAATEGSGYLGGRLFRFRDKPGKYVIEANFESWEAAEANNDRPETQQWAARLNDLIDGEPKYENLDVIAEF
jgi:quinol monooxygenase YgiN